MVLYIQCVEIKANTTFFFVLFCIVLYVKKKKTKLNQCPGCIEFSFWTLHIYMYIFINVVRQIYNIAYTITKDTLHIYH